MRAGVLEESTPLDNCEHLCYNAYKEKPFLSEREGRCFVLLFQITWRPSRALDSVTSSAYSS